MERLDTRLPFGGMHRTFDAKRRAGVSVEPYAGNTCDEQAHQLALRDGGRFQKEVFDVPARRARGNSEARRDVLRCDAFDQQSGNPRFSFREAVQPSERVLIRFDVTFRIADENDHGRIAHWPQSGSTHGLH